MIDNQKCIILINLMAGRGKSRRKLSKLIIALSKYNISFEIRQTKAPRHGIEIARDVILQGYRKIVAVGGDGTINEVINGIMLSGKNSETTVGIIPLGGGNDFSKNFGIPSNIEEAVKILKANKTQMIDVGKIDDRYFINSLGAGFDAEVALFATKISFLNGLPRYLFAVLAALLNLKFHKWEIIADSKKIVSTYLLISFGNGKYCGGGFKLNPGAVIDDGFLDVCLVEKVSPFKILTLLSTVIKGEHIGKKEVEIIRTKRFEINSNQKIPIYFDGEIPLLKNNKHLIIQLIPKQIRLIVG